MNEETSTRDELLDEIEPLRARVKELEGQLLRALADFDNFRKRVERQRQEGLSYALQNFLVELLPVKDSLERALDAAADDTGRESEALKAGIRLTLRMWSDVLARSRVEEIDPLGKPFDPDFHEAVSIRQVRKPAPNTVLEVVRRGYLLNGRLIRPAQVIVAGGHP